jgi:cystathionine beta-lyase/cystathionine gamma-synthase
MKSPEPRSLGFATRSVHVGQEPDPVTGAIVTPIHTAATFAQEGVGKPRGFEYARTDNPTRHALEDCLASLESGRHAVAFASGMAAATNVLLLLEPGDHVIYMEDIYGGSFRLFDKVMSRYGLTFTAVDARDAQAVEAAFGERTRMLWLESPTNPLLRICDLHSLSELAHRHDALVCVDNTFATPYLQRPLELGADLVVHSSTKYIGGHSDVVGGCVITSDDALLERLRFQQNAVGAVPSPFDCWLLLRGIKTLALRVGQQCRSALEIAAWLEEQDVVAQVYYPGLLTHPQHTLAAQQMKGGFGGMLSFDVGNEERAVAVLEKLRLIALAESLGAVTSLAAHPARMTHASVPAEERERIGVEDGLIRLSVGVEDVEDLIADLEQALG